MCGPRRLPARQAAFHPACSPGRAVGLRRWDRQWRSGPARLSRGWVLAATSFWGNTQNKLLQARPHDGSRWLSWALWLLWRTAEMTGKWQPRESLISILFKSLLPFCHQNNRKVVCLFFLSASPAMETWCSHVVCLGCVGSARWLSRCGVWLGLALMNFILYLAKRSV